MSFALIYHPNKRHLVNQIATSGLNILLSQHNKKNYNIVLTGGTSGSDLADCLVKYLNKRKYVYFLKKTELHFWLSDERFVEKNSDERNANIVFNSLKNLSKEYVVFFHEMKSAENYSIENAKNLYEKELELNLKSDIFDLVILSLSGDGHLASIFSTSKKYDLSSSKVEVTQNPLVESPLRLSLSLSQLAQTKMLIILAYQEKLHLRKRRFLKDPSSIVSRLIELVMMNNSQSTILIYTNEEE
jgi:6-phosphogluconolactonase/glucosamine-6-phosphate isomerase/deaminase